MEKVDMTDKHTPGPWFAADYDPETDEIAICSDQGEYVAHIGHIDADGCFDHPKIAAMIEANARLIAAAPDMLEALRQAAICENQDAFRNRRPVAPWYESACAAIAKAEGRE
jgi:hypothetical protein